MLFSFLLFLEQTDTEIFILNHRRVGWHVRCLAAIKEKFCCSLIYVTITGSIMHNRRQMSQSHQISL